MNVNASVGVGRERKRERGVAGKEEEKHLRVYQWYSLLVCNCKQPLWYSFTVDKSNTLNVEECYFLVSNYDWNFSYCRCYYEQNNCQSHGPPVTHMPVSAYWKLQETFRGVCKTFLLIALSPESNLQQSYLENLAPELLESRALGNHFWMAKQVCIISKKISILPV